MSEWVCVQCVCERLSNWMKEHVCEWVCMWDSMCVI